MLRHLAVFVTTTPTRDSAPIRWAGGCRSANVSLGSPDIGVGRLGRFPALLTSGIDQLSDVTLVLDGCRDLEDLYMVITNYSTVAITGRRYPPVPNSVHVVMP